MKTDKFCRIGLLLLLQCTPLCAEVVLDGSLGGSGALEGPDFVISATDGRQAGGNLFHSFSRFNVYKGESATFAGPGTTENIISRVTGGTLSTIDGLVKSSIPGADFYFMNPAGILFGEQARLDVSGSVFFSTAERLFFSLDEWFAADDREGSTFSTAPPGHFGFLSDSPAPVEVNGGLLRVPQGKTLSIIGGDVTLHNSALYAPDGRIEVIASAGSSEAGASPARFGAIRFTRSPDVPLHETESGKIADMDVSGYAGGKVWIQGGRFFAQNTQITSQVLADSQAVVREGEHMHSHAGAWEREETGAWEREETGAWERKENKTIIAGSVGLFAKGDGGSIYMEAPEIKIRDGAKIQTGTASAFGGKAGDIHLAAQNLLADGSVITVETVGTHAQAKGGDIVVQTERLTLRNAARIVSESRGDGSAGTVDIQAESVRMEGQSRISTAAAYTRSDDLTIYADKELYVLDSSINASASGSELQDKGGNVHLSRPRLMVLNQADIKTTGYRGDGGNIVVESEHLLSSSDTVLDASSSLGVDGEVRLNAPDADISTALVTPPPAFFQPRLRSRCEKRFAEDFSEFHINLPYDILPFSPESMQGYFPLPSDLEDGLPPVSAFSAGNYQQAAADLQERLQQPLSSKQRMDILLYLAAALRFLGQAGSAHKNLAQALRLARAKKDEARQIIALVQQSILRQFQVGGGTEQFTEHLPVHTLQTAISLTTRLQQPVLSAAVWMQTANLLRAQKPEAKALNTYLALLAGFSGFSVRELRELGREASAAKKTGDAAARYKEAAFEALLILYEKAFGLAQKNLHGEIYLAAAVNRLQVISGYLEDKRKNGRLQYGEEERWKELLGPHIDSLLKKAGRLSETKKTASALMAMLSAAGLFLSKRYGYLQEKVFSVSGERYQAELKSLLEKAVILAENLQNNELKFLAYSRLAARHIHRKEYDKALEKAHLALRNFGAKSTQNFYAAYEFYVQSGRIYAGKKRLREALEAYRQAVFYLKKLWPVLLARYSGSGESFFQEANAVYREQISLMLKLATDTGQALFLSQATGALEQLKQFELQNYFQDECIARPGNRRFGRGKLAEHAAALYPVLLEPHPVLLLALPDGEVKQFMVPQRSEELSGMIRTFIAGKAEDRRLANRLYSAFISPLEKALNAYRIETLVIVPDGILRTLPFSALHDGQRYLLEKPYAIAITPALSLTAPSGGKKDRDILLGGLSSAVQGFPALPHVETELERIYASAAKRTKIPVTNESFVIEELRGQLAAFPYGVVHLATHGVFKPYFRESFLLAYRGRIDLNELEKLLNASPRGQPMELLTLSACDTALDIDAQAGLGLVGIALKTGVKSVLATLWQVEDDTAAELMPAFYRHWPAHSKAKALQLAQRSLFSKGYHHPASWAGFIMIGNW
ncbi:MAG: CHAT domain-containing protein [Gammaproteobacteria bacterium]|nr:CHAT domain-containing protein [Gammaproteobacteria bacterium]